MQARQNCELLSRRCLPVVFVLFNVLLATPCLAWYKRVPISFQYGFAPTLHTALSNCDNCAAAVSLPWPFPYYGIQFSQLTISSNGYVLLGSRATSSEAILTGARGFDTDGTYASMPDRSIAPWYYNWDTRGTGGEIWYGRRTSAAFCGGAQDCFIVEWWFVKDRTSPLLYTFELKLFPDGAFEFHYRNVDRGGLIDGGARGSVGYQHTNDTVGDIYLPYFSDNVLDDGTAVRFHRPGTSVLYYKATDNIWSRPREGVGVKFNVNCGASAQSWIGYTDSDGRVRVSDSSCTPSGYPTMALESLDQQQGYLTVAKDVVGRRRWEGNYIFAKDLDRVSPKATRPPLTFPTPYGGGTTYRSRLEVWQSGPFDKPLLIVPGYDAYPFIENNEDHAGSILYGLRAALRPLMDLQGYDIVVGDWGDGNRTISQLSDSDVTSWVDWTYAAFRNQGGRADNDYRVQMAGLSMGGVISRRYLVDHGTSRIRAWYSLDAPHRGANLGGDIEHPNYLNGVTYSSGGLQCLIGCNGERRDVNRLLNVSANGLAFYTVSPTGPYGIDDGWVCDEQPQRSYCYMTADRNSTDDFGWPSRNNVPMYAVANGSAQSSAQQTTDPGGLIAFQYHDMDSWPPGCPDDGWSSWKAGSWDCSPGSHYLNEGDKIRGASLDFHIPHHAGASDNHKRLDEDTAIGACEGFLDIYIRGWRPSYIPTSSALGGSARPSFTGTACGWTYTGTQAGSMWTDHVSASTNTWHVDTPGPTVTRLLDWIINGAGAY
jgi:pimeloyl-ACP methyl ester carboxylesterase